MLRKIRRKNRALRSKSKERYRATIVVPIEEYGGEKFIEFWVTETIGLSLAGMNYVESDRMSK